MALNNSSNVLALLTPENKASFASFAQLCAESDNLVRLEGLENQDLRDGLSDPPTLLRFLTARQFDPAAALKQFQEACQFRYDKHILRLYDLVEIADYEQSRQFYPHWTGRRDKEGLPICMFDIAHFDKENLACWDKTRKTASWAYSQSGKAQAPKADMWQLASVLQDTLIRFIFPLCSVMQDRPRPLVPITSCIGIVDGSSLGLKLGWSLRFFAQEISWLLSTCYPETITRIFVCNAPPYFSTIWKYLKPWVDPRTAEKVVILMSADVLPTLREYIDDVNIPTAFGGSLLFKHGMRPLLDEHVCDHFNWDLPERSLPPGPIKWIKDADGNMAALAVGGEKGFQRSELIATRSRVDN
ncbi:hypothetical protein N7448_000619 [Penicillium atrosanguineum]|uniref:Uncharacterized protein n=1 Tax=Penicillium atrosanguineum TaxID=1132637 RepID=A0A9W9LCE5_9EURO|nr:uncharacterized protein N7443_004015 [Penicillium atrosanguineum]KAJ5134358.1 hypothetical protein N7526_005723 [Penicillium atrosanguineum]KAJ5149041.1 hypothetical protein N7448_000619 [Penicillium atrosanguineum]KAJ5304355.1 hypothetical protein N7443_004015 [Penicillium atrosanguineum]KAJ5323827.1 hypothetical protein N7476_002427 [Penicillium atrosanguineum]